MPGWLPILSLISLIATGLMKRSAGFAHRSISARRFWKFCTPLVSIPNRFLMPRLKNIPVRHPPNSGDAAGVHPYGQRKPHQMKIVSASSFQTGCHESDWHFPQNESCKISSSFFYPILHIKNND